MALCRSIFLLVAAVAVALTIIPLITNSRFVHIELLVLGVLGFCCGGPLCCLCTSYVFARHAALSVVSAISRARTRKPCTDTLDCTAQDRAHHRSFSHPGDDDYGFSVRCHGGTPQFSTLRQCFNFMDPCQLGYVAERAALDELLRARRNARSDKMRHAWSNYSVADWCQTVRHRSFSEKIFRDIDTDGNGYISFPEWVEWATGPGQSFGFPVHVGIVHQQKVAARVPVPCSVEGCLCSCFQFANAPTDTHCSTPGCAHYRVYHTPSLKDQVLNALPSHWTLDDTVEDLFHARQRVACGTSVVQQLQKLMDASVKTTWTRDRGTARVPKSYEVVRVERNENVRVWLKYVLKRALMKEAFDNRDEIAPYKMRTSMLAETLPMFGPEWPEAAMNEWYLWHGATSSGAVGIAENEFKQSYAGSNVGTLYGRGTYLSDSCTKADEYAKEASDGPDTGLCCLVLCRVMGGNVRYCEEAQPDPAVLERDVLEREYDCIFGDREKCRNTFKEIVIYESTQAYPEYLVHYRRIY